MEVRRPASLLDGWYEAGLQAAELSRWLSGVAGGSRTTQAALYLEDVRALYEQGPSKENEISGEFHEGLRDGLMRAGVTVDSPWREYAIVQCVVESLRRCRDARLAYESLADLDVSVFLAGSLMYGRFYSIMQRRSVRPSDLDMVVVVPDREAISDVVTRLAAMPVARREADDVSLHLANCREHMASADLVDYMAVVSLWTDRVDEISAQWDAARAYELSVHICARADFHRYVLPLESGATTATGSTFRAVSGARRGRGKLTREVWSAYTGDERIDEVVSTAMGGGSVELRRPFLSVAGMPYIGRFLRSLLPRLEAMTIRPEDAGVMERCADALADLHELAVRSCGLPVGYEMVHPHRADFSPGVTRECRTLRRPLVRMSEILL